ncbi:hypothetical protein CDG76_09145 [Nostoc sp. 'Peltigera membranacea cyanobiont' 210A]|uniref:DUF4209 domain-containing protein n=1 Tax=Nostoc sp. 'Peltigera membranacea cyanobiont' 210A TaxID=2014529 RepID=UPI000B958729|nr:DUF4209 domain-containing protein [Nostoc sp. 'Peltigera membranacea cyanobiont' 210A]OYD96903.1 hypothetical protein CDG76_09145 [Nostoc sp. 'Peltigera membranacea cyanobiont' 210A]
MPLINPPLTKENFINSRWQDVVNSSERKECSAYNRVFWNKAQEAKEAGNVREQSVFEILAFVTGVAIKPESTDEFFAEVFQNLTDEHLNFLTEISPEVSNPELQARIADILWVKKRNYQMAQLAVTAYLQSATELEDPEKWIWCFERIERALRLARKINYQAELVVARIETVLDRYKGEDSRCFSAKLMELLQEYRIGDPIKYAALAEKAANLAESVHHWRKARKYWEIKAKWHLFAKDGDKVRTAQMLAAETYVKEGDDALKRTPSSYLVASHFMQKAVEAFRTVSGTKEEIETAKQREAEVHKLLIQYGEESRKELIAVSRQVNVNPEVIEQARAHVRGKEFQDALFSLAFLGTSPSVSSLRQEVQNTTHQYVTSHHFPVVMINNMGKVVARQSSSVLSSNSEDAEKAIQFEMYRYAVYYQTFHAQTSIEPARYHINLEHSVRVDDLLSIVLHSPFVAPGREYQFAKGLYAGLTGDFFTSTHILIPQIENSIRHILWQQQGAISSKLDKGIQDEFLLKQILSRPEITAIFDEDTLFDLKGLLIERGGSNLRNRMAHGLINDGEFNSPIMSYLWWVTLRLCCLPMLKHEQQVEESNPWVKFDGIFKDDPLFDDFVEDMAVNRSELDAEVAAYEASLEENQSA